MKSDLIAWVNDPERILAAGPTSLGCQCEALNSHYSPGQGEFLTVCSVTWAHLHNGVLLCDGHYKQRTQVMEEAA